MLSPLAKLYNKFNKFMATSFHEHHEVVKTTPRKPSDTTKITQYMYDYVVNAHKEFLEYNRTHPKSRKTTKELTVVLNERMGLQKSVTSYSQIWCRKLDRDTLAVGKPYFNS